jgi:hypothetical protein
MLALIKGANFNFLDVGKKAGITSIVIIVLTLGLFFGRAFTTPVKVLGVDFTGGSAMTFSYDKQAPIGDVRSTIEDVDKAVKNGLNYPMGPFELMDLTGIDIAYFVSEYFYKELNKESKWASPNLLKTMVRAGKLGKKTGSGWYE